MKEIFLKLITFLFQLPHLVLNICIFFLANSKASNHVSKSCTNRTYKSRSAAAARNRCLGA